MQARHISRLLILLIAAGCAAGSDEAVGFEEVLPDGTVRVHNRLPGLWGDRDAWRLTLETTIGAVDGIGPDVFSRIAGLQVGEDGTIYLLDPAANELRAFTPSGAHIRSTGRSGQGPGEYLRAIGLLQMPGDSLVVVDHAGQRLTVLDDLEYVRSVPRQQSFSAGTFTGALARGRVYESSPIVFPGRRPTMSATPLGDEPLPAALDSIELPLLGPEPPAPFSLRLENATMTLNVPFISRMVHRLDENGNLWYGHGGKFRILRAEMDGRVGLEIILEVEPNLVTSEEVEAWRARVSQGAFVTGGGVVDLSRIPRTKPYFTNLFIDRDGYLWVLVPSEEGSTRFALFEPEGRFLGYLQLDQFDWVQAVPPVIRHGRLHIIGRREFGVERVHVFRIDRESD